MIGVAYIFHILKTKTLHKSNLFKFFYAVTKNNQVKDNVYKKKSP